MTKLILTEQQLKNIEDYYLLESYINEFGEINESIDLNALWQKYKQAIVAGVASTVILASISNLNISPRQKNILYRMAQTELQNNTENINNQSDSLFQKKVECVKDYMKKAVKNQGFNPENIQLSPEEMVNACEQTGFDLPLLMAQAHLESCFGFGKRARKTGSVFSVGCWDDGSNRSTYSNQNQSILPYINLMKNDYLKNKDIDTLLKPNGFINMNGHRYAQDKNYEQKVKSIRNKIIKNYPELAS